MSAADGNFRGGAGRRVLVPGRPAPDDGTGGGARPLA